MANGTELRPGVGNSPAAAVNTLPTNAVWFQLMTPKKVLAAGIEGPQMDIRATGPDMNSVAGEVVRLGLMNKPHCITMSICIVSRG